ncbi:MAG: hypothetical protein ABH871_00640 [Pseudomonadota bacterium]
MKLSERGAMRSAIADGGFHVYPAGRLMELVLAGLSADDLRGDFNPATTIDKMSQTKGPDDPLASKLFHLDIDLLKSRLSTMEPDYDIEGVFDRMMQAAPDMAKRYYGIDGFEPCRPKIVEYFFEGYNELYKDGDWFAFNVSTPESKELSVPVGTYFKRDQVSPGHPEMTAMHEANHAMQERAFTPEGVHHYVPWLDEGLADAMARMMLVRATSDWTLMSKLKRFKSELEVTDPRKSTYHFGEETAILMLMRGRIPFIKAFMAARRREPYSIDYNFLGEAIKEGVDPHVAVVQAYKGDQERSFLKRIERDETKFRKDADLDGTDLKVLSMFMASERPACISPAEYKAALWITEEVKKTPCEHWVPGENSLVPCSSVGGDVWKKTAGLETKIVVKDSSVPFELKDGIAKLTAKYFILKKTIGDELVYEPYGGGLPYRLGTGEIRCTY